MSKKELLKQVNESGGSFIFLTHSKTKTCKPIGYVRSEKSLKTHIAAYATETGATTVKVMGGRNIMDDTGPTATFKVAVKVE